MLKIGLTVTTEVTGIIYIKIVGMMLSPEFYKEDLVSSWSAKRTWNY